MFWIFAALLVALALIMILPPLLKKTELEVDDRRDQNIQIAKEQLAELETSFSNKEMSDDEYQQRRDELEQSLYTDVEGSSETNKKIEYAKPTLITAVAVAVLVPLIGAGMYSVYGNSKAADPETARIAGKVPMTADGQPDVDAMLVGLSKKLEENPNNPEGWYMMGRSYMALKRYGEAVGAYEKMLSLQPEDAKVMLFLADAVAMKNGGNISGQPAELIEKSLAIEPNSVTGLWLGGMAAQQQGQHEKAIQRWETLIPLLANEAEQVAEVRQLIAESKKQLSPQALTKMPAASTPLAAAQTAPSIPAAPMAPAAPVAPAINNVAANAPATAPVVNQAASSQAVADTMDAVADPQSIVVSVSLADHLRAQASPTDTVFIYAKAVAGPPMPLAAKRIQVKDLPVTIVLDDSTAMMPQMKLSAFPQVTIGARVSKSGNAISANGDLYVEKSPIEKGTQQMLVIDAVLQK